MDFQGKKVLVTGVTGFIGSNLTRNLLKKGAKIYAIDNFSYIDVEMAKRKLDFLDEIELIEGDVTEKESWAMLPPDIEYIFHFAGASSITSFKTTPEKCYHETVFSLYNAFEFAKNNNVKKIVYPSSGSVYSGNEMPHSESIYPQPRNLYAASKMACEGIASAYSNYVKSMGLRIFVGYGPGEEWKKDFGSVLYLFIKDCMEGKKPVIFGDGKQTRGFIYIDDIVKVIIASAEIDDVGIVNVGVKDSISFNELLEIIKKILNVDVEPKYVPREINYLEHIKADTNRMDDLFDINPIELEEELKKFIKYLKTSL